MRRTVVSPGFLTYELPHPSRCRKFLLGLSINAACAFLLAVVNPQFFTSIETRPLSVEDHHVTLFAPTRPTEPQPTPPVRVARIKVPKVPAPPIETKPIPIPHKTVPPPSPERPPIASKVATPPTSRPAPGKQIKTDVFSTTKPQVTLHQPPRQVQTGGFGDPNGVPAQRPSNKEALTVARLGAFDLPSGGGRGNGTGGAHGASGTIRSAGFGDPASSEPVAHEARTVQTGGFASVVPKADHASVPQTQDKPVLQPVEIVYKPRPAYTAEARRQKVEGEVLLDVVFAASGSLRVNRVVKGLGFGLDDMALAAAERIQFHPAKRDGQPYDCAALVHIVFELPK